MRKKSVILIIIGIVGSYFLSTKYVDFLILKYSSKYNIDKNIIEAVMLVESKKIIFAIGTSGEIGLMQLMPATARLFDYTKPFIFLFLPSENINVGTKFLSYLTHRYDLDKAVQCYNLGETKYGKGIRNPNYLSKFYKYFNDLRSKND